MSTDELVRLTEILKPYGMKGISCAEHDVIYFDVEWDDVPETLQEELTGDDSEFVGLHESEGSLACFV